MVGRPSRRHRDHLRLDAVARGRRRQLGTALEEQHVLGTHGERCTLTRPRLAGHEDAGAAHVDSDEPIHRTRDHAVDRLLDAEECRGPFVHGKAHGLFGRTHCHDPALVHDRDAIGHNERLVLVVGHVENRHVRLAENRGEVVGEPMLEQRIEGGERLVDQQHARLDHQRPRERDALRFTAG